MRMKVIQTLIHVFFESALSINHGKHPPLRYPWKAGAIVSVTNSYLMHRWFYYHDRLQPSTVYPCLFYIRRKKECKDE